MESYSSVQFISLWVFLVLASYRFAHVLAFELGPGAIFEKIRKYLVKTRGEESLYLEFIRCPLCTSFWISLCLTFLFFPKIGLWDIPVVWFSASGAVLVLHNWLYK